MSSELAATCHLIVSVSACRQFTVDLSSIAILEMTHSTGGGGAIQRKRNAGEGPAVRKEEGVCEEVLQWAC
jgi:hypothetical protein